MEFITVSHRDSVATVTLARGKVHAINEAMLAELHATFERLAIDEATHAVVLTGTGKFLSFGFDIPELYAYSPEQMTVFVRSYCELYRMMFLLSKPLVAAVNGHAVAGGCILALACDHRIMADESAKMSLNEVTFGASLFAGVVEMLRYWAGNTVAEEVLLTGRMFGPEEAKQRGLADELVPASEVMARAVQQAQQLAIHGGPAYASLKGHLRKPVADGWAVWEEESIREWIRIWYSPETRELAKGIQIR